MGIGEILTIIFLAPILWTLGKFFLDVMILGGIFAAVFFYVLAMWLWVNIRERIRRGKKIWPQ
jgi:uncharacterized protein (DUF2062 family)